MTATVDVPGEARQKISGQDDLLKAAMAVRTYLSSLKVELLDINITFAPGKTSAVANLTLKARVNGDRDFIPQELKFTLKKVKGEWLIREAETVRTLSKTLNKLNDLHLIFLLIILHLIHDLLFLLKLNSHNNESISSLFLLLI